jgi:hypothetical protein
MRSSAVRESDSLTDQSVVNGVCCFMIWNGFQWPGGTNRYLRERETKTILTIIVVDVPQQPMVTPQKNNSAFQRQIITRIPNITVIRFVGPCIVTMNSSGRVRRWLMLYYGLLNLLSVKLPPVYLSICCGKFLIQQAVYTVISHSYHFHCIPTPITILWFFLSK